MNQRGARRVVGVAVCAAALVGGGATTALAGEITGNGKKVLTVEPHVLHGQSACAWSGQNDGYFDGTETARVQSYGYDIVRAGLKNQLPFGPGVACNPTAGFEE